MLLLLNFKKNLFKLNFIELYIHVSQHPDFYGQIIESMSKLTLKFG